MLLLRIMDLDLTWKNVVFQFPLHRECCCYSAALPGRRSSTLTFSSLFIGNAAVTAADERLEAHEVNFQFPLHRECCCYRRRARGGRSGARHFQFPLHRECCCYRVMKALSEPDFVTFSSLFIGNAAVTRQGHQRPQVERVFQFPLHRECCCYRPSRRPRR